MPVTFQDREQAFEARFARDEEFRFLVHARRDKLFARWAAARLDLSGDEADALVKAVLAIPDGHGHDEKLVAMIGALLATNGLDRGTDLSAVLDRCRQDAQAQMTAHPLGSSDRF